MEAGRTGTRPGDRGTRGRSRRVSRRQVRPRRLYRMGEGGLGPPENSASRAPSGPAQGKGLSGDRPQPAAAELAGGLPPPPESHLGLSAALRPNQPLCLPSVSQRVCVFPRSPAPQVHARFSLGPGTRRRPQSRGVKQAPNLRHG